MGGINVDPTNPAGRPSAETLKNMGCRWVRLVSRPEAEDYAAACRAAGLLVLAVIGRESLDEQGVPYLMANADMYEVGNEPDLDSPSSWTMSPDAWLWLWHTIKQRTDKPCIVGGQASGQLDWWQAVAPRLTGAAGFAVHPYAKTPAQARDLLAQLQSISPGLEPYVTEYRCEVREIAEFSTIAPNCIWFCWSDGMVDGFGLVDANGLAKPELFAIQEAWMATNEELDARIRSEEQRNAWLVEWLWRYGDGASSQELREHALRLASACDPGEGSRPR